VPATLRTEHHGDEDLLIRMSGEWKLGLHPPADGDVARKLQETPGLKRLSFDTRDLTGWDTSILPFVRNMMHQADRTGVAVDTNGLPAGVQRLLELAASVPERTGARRGEAREPLLSRIGTQAIDFGIATKEVVSFTGEVALAFGRLLRGTSLFRFSDLVVQLQENGVRALPIVSLISVLVGLIFGFVGAVQLKMFGAQIYLADLVGIVMVRVMGAVMTGVIMAGRTGARFAAEIGTMQVNEEIDALRTLGISPVEYLVLPRMLGLTIMMPLLYRRRGNVRPEHTRVLP
jgi:phospholipid/cholesterol/gamma-HCH transport system permease protein